MPVASPRKSSRLQALDSGFRRSDVAVISYAIALGRRAARLALTMVSFAPGLAYLRWACRALLFFSARYGYRVCALTASSGQFCRGCDPYPVDGFPRGGPAWVRVSVRWSDGARFALTTVLRLAALFRILRVGFPALPGCERSTPGLTRGGRMKVKSKVPPITCVTGFTQGSPPYMWRHLLQSLGVPRFPSAGRCTHISIADHPPRLQTPAAQLTSGAGTRGNAFSRRFGRPDDPKMPEIAQTAMRARIRGVYGDSVGRSDRRFCNLRLAYRGQRDPPSPNTSRRFGATTPHTVLES